MDPGFIWVVGFAIIPNELDIIQNLFYFLVPIFPKLFIDGGQVHGIFDDGEIIGESHAFPIDWLSEVVAFVGLFEAVADDYF